MSTSTLGGFEREERKVLFDEYLFQRRVLFGLSLSIVFLIFVWTFAICSDHWIIVESEDGIFVPVSGRYFLSSHTGLWRLCRYALTPILLSNSSLPVSLTSLISLNASVISLAKNRIVRQSFVNDSLRNNVLVDAVTTIDNPFKERLFAEWITESTEFPKFKSKFKSLRPSENSPKTAKTNSPSDVLIPYTHDSIELYLKSSVDTIAQQNNAKIDVIVPEALRLALFDGWQRNPDIPVVLGEFAKDMEISISLTSLNGTRLILQPPEPPKGSVKTKGDFFYKKFAICKNHNFFPTEEEIGLEAGVDDATVGYRVHEIDMYLDSLKMRMESKELEVLTRTQASFACFALLIMSMGFVFSMYTFLNPRYMFKRLAAGVHFISAAVIFIVLRIVFYLVKYEEDHLSYLFPEGADYKYGYAVYLAWIVFAVNATASFVFLWYSKKRKGNKAPTEEIAMADEPINIGR